MRDHRLPHRGERALEGAHGDVELASQRRRGEPGCLTFTAYEARDTPGRFYLYEVYAGTGVGPPVVDAAARRVE